MSTPITTPPAPGRAEALLPCPHCECSDIKYYVRHSSQEVGWGDGLGSPGTMSFSYHTFYCSKCGAQVESSTSKEHAREAWNRRPAPAIVAEVGDTAKRVKIPADKFEIRWSGDPDVEVVLASDYDAALRTLAEVRVERDALAMYADNVKDERDAATQRADKAEVALAEVQGERDQWVARACGLLSMLPDSTTCGEVREAAKPWYEMKAQRDAATQQAQAAYQVFRDTERELEAQRDAATQRAEQAEAALADYQRRFSEQECVDVVRDLADAEKARDAAQSVLTKLRDKLPKMYCDLPRHVLDDINTALPAPATNATGSSHEQT